MLDFMSDTCFVTSVLSTSIWPVVGVKVPQSMRIVVDLPQPLEPSNPKIFPFFNSNIKLVDGCKITESAHQVLRLNNDWFIGESLKVMVHCIIGGKFVVFIDEANIYFVQCLVCFYIGLSS